MGRRAARERGARGRRGASRLVLALTAALGWAAPGLSGGPALAQAPVPVQGATCGARAEVVSRLKAKYGETRRGYGLQRGQAVVEIYASSETGSWTIIMSMPNGLACLVAAGENWAAPGAEAAEAPGDPA
ncbi:hypothetical protein [Albimonas pacifica]|uniref:hypothetical protein n=1 Tax=Albimonas pacifica TaxID=1114924 RepID=UPI000B814D7C|nr:hypothetical protein [Albimonas pacifica]